MFCFLPVSKYILFNEAFIYGFTLCGLLPLSYIVTCNIDPSDVWSWDRFAHLHIGCIFKPIACCALWI